MGDDKNMIPERKSTKKSAAVQKSFAKKNQKEKTMPEAKSKSPASSVSSSSITAVINEIEEKIENAPLKSFERKDREMIVQSYERLIFKMVREINNSRQ